MKHLQSRARAAGSAVRLRRLRPVLQAAVIMTVSAVLAACSTQQLLQIATSGNPRLAARQALQGQAHYYETHPEEFVRQFRALVAKLRGHAKKEWGAREAVTPTKRQYVKYTQNYKSRALVNFDKGTVTVETVDTAHPQTSLRTAIVSTLLTPEDPRSVDLYSDKPVRLTGKPYLYGLVTDQHGHSIDTPDAASNYADYLIKQAKTRTVKTAEGSRTDHYVRIGMVPDHVNVQAKKYAPLVDRYATRYQVSKSLVYAIIKVESDFNPYAVSNAGAFGLMQLIPTTAGTDAYEAVYGKQMAPSRDYLFDPQHNIELGTAYLNILSSRYLAKIANPVSLEYCTIAAYNAGAGTVFKQFSSHQGDAISRINASKPPSVYKTLADGQGPLEMRQYLVKVLDARRDFVVQTAGN
ncbi:MAG TPA: murein transglycosylase domain-containing protein [Gammaproteobacteria bacterium]|nr:murein transglycosylase domain-containing protein [Gammaproteobacteria bacterium]